jgi:hypothetical protein
MPVVGFRINGSDWIKRTSITASNLDRSLPIQRLRRLAPAEGGDDSRSQQHITTERSDSSEFEFSRAAVVNFWWGLLLRDDSDEGNVFMLTLIGGERQRSPTMVTRLGRCLLTVRAASSEASALRMCTKASFSSLLDSWPTNCSDRWVLDLRPKIHAIRGAIYRGF